MQKVEKGVAKYDRVLRLGDLFSRRKLPLEKKALTEQNESTKALFQHYSSILQEVRWEKTRLYSQKTYSRFSFFEKLSAAEEMKEQSEQLEREQLSLAAAQKKAEKELSWKCGVRDHLEKFAEVQNRGKEEEKH